MEALGSLKNRYPKYGAMERATTTTGELLAKRAYSIEGEGVLFITRKYHLNHLKE